MISFLSFSKLLNSAETVRGFRAVFRAVFLLCVADPFFLAAFKTPFGGYVSGYKSEYRLLNGGRNVLGLLDLSM